MQSYKKATRPWLVLAIITTITGTGCTLQRMVRQAKKQEITVLPNPLMANGEKVNFELKATVPASIIKDNYRYKLDVYYVYGTEVREQVGALNFEFGEFIYEKGRPSIVKQFDFPYAPAKDKGKLYIQGTAIDKRNGRLKYTKPALIASGLITTPLLLVRNNNIQLVPDSYKADPTAPAILPFYFEPEETKLRSYLGSNLQVLDQYILDNVATQTITIKASQAPDEYSKKVAEKRASTIKEYYQQKVQTLDYSGKKVTINTTSAKTDWNLLLAKLQVSALPKTQLDEVADIITGKSSDAEKATALEKTEAFDYLQQYVYPAMRYAQVTINYNRERKSDYKLYLLAKKIANQEADADVLTEEELQYAASLTPLLAEKKKLYEAAVQTTDKWPAYYNLGVIYVEMARKDHRPKARQALLARAIHNLTYAGFRNPTAEVYYSLASAHHVRGNKLEALQYYDYALKLGGSQQILQHTFADKAALEIEIGQYDDAIESLRHAGDSYQTNINLGLSYLLKENYEGAEQYYNRALELKPNDALAHYSLALVGARTRQEQMLTENLRKAVNADRTFTQKAIEDIEFGNYRGKSAFEDALSR